MLYLTIDAVSDQTVLVEQMLLRRRAMSTNDQMLACAYQAVPRVLKEQTNSAAKETVVSKP